MNLKHQDNFILSYVQEYFSSQVKSSVEVSITEKGAAQLLMCSTHCESVIWT